MLATIKENEELDIVDAKMAHMYASGACVTLDQFRSLGFMPSGCPPGVYLIYVNGVAKVGRSTDAYLRYLSYLSILKGPNKVFLVGFLAALPGESLNKLEADLIKICLETDERVGGREWFKTPEYCLEALCELSRHRIQHTPGIVERDDEPLVARTTTHKTPVEEQVAFLYPAYVSATCRRITYLVMALDHETGSIVVDKVTVPYRETWTILACYVQDPGAVVSMGCLRETLNPALRCEKIAAFFELNSVESDLFFYTS